MLFPRILILLSLLLVPLCAQSAKELVAASMRGDSNRVVRLLESGVDPDAVSDGSSALGAAAAGGRIDVLDRLLLAGADPELTTPSGTALLRAARAGLADAVNRLLEGGADPAHAGPAGQTAEGLARIAGHERVARILSSPLPSTQFPVTRTERPAPGADLWRLTSQVQDGTLIMLGPGRYTGPVVASGKRLSIVGTRDTIIEAPEQACVAQVVARGVLLLKGMTLVAKHETSIGVFVEDSLAGLRGVTIKGCGNAIQARKGTLLVTNCQLKDSSSNAIVASESRLLIVRDTLFAGSRHAAVAFEKGGAMELRHNRFERCGQAAMVNGAEGILLVKNSVFTTAADVPAFLMTAPGHLVATDNRIGGSYGIVLSGELQAPAAIARNTFLGIRGTAVTLKGPGPEKRAMAVLVRNTMLSVGGGAVTAVQGARLVLVKNTLLSLEEATLSLQSGASALLRGNLVFSQRAALNFFESRASRTSVRGDLLLGPLLGAQGLDMDARAGLRRKRAETTPLPARLATEINYVLFAQPPPHVSLRIALGRITTLIAALDAALDDPADKN